MTLVYGHCLQSLVNAFVFLGENERILGIVGKWSHARSSDPSRSRKTASMNCRGNVTRQFADHIGRRDTLQSVKNLSRTSNGVSALIKSAVCRVTRKSLQCTSKSNKRWRKPIRSSPFAIEDSRLHRQNADVACIGVWHSQAQVMA